MGVDRWGLSEGQGASYVIQPFRVAGPGDFSGPLPMGVVVEEERGHPVGDASMERGGVGGDSMFFPLPVINPGHIIQWRFIADCPPPLLQFTSSPRIQRFPK